MLCNSSSSSSSSKPSSSSSGSSNRNRRDRSSRDREHSTDQVNERLREKQKDSQKEKTSREGSSDIETYDLTTRIDKEEEQKRLEQEMTKRRDRIERWRAERKRKELENKKVTEKIIVVPTAKKWSLENESDDDDDVKEVLIKEVENGDAATFKESKAVIEPQKDTKEDIIKMEVGGDEEEDDEIDPLDAYMEEVNKEVRKVNQISKPSNASRGVLVVTGIAKKNVEVKKGEMMEQNQDGLEYSSEEEIEDIKDTAANLANKHKKELAKIDHSGVDYLPFRKDFYVEVPELAKMTPTEVDAYKSELEGIQVKGKGCPKPIKTWAHCGVSKKEMDVLKKLGFEKPTPIQCQAIPAIMSGNYLIYYTQNYI